MDVHAHGLRTLAELTLALVLFTDAASADLRVLRVSYAIPERLLLIGLPLTILLGTGAATLLFPALGIVQCALLATMLAPTDAALGKAVVSNPAVPPPIREGLNVESGLNDGICVPVVLILLELATEPAGGSWELVLRHFVEEIGIGLVVGAGWPRWGFGRCAPPWSGAGRPPVWRQLPVAALAFTTFAAAQALGGSGFIACFVGGLVAGGMARRQEQKHEFLLAAEGAGDIFALLTWVLFGSAVIGEALGRLSWEVLAYAVLSLTAIRMVPVWVALAGTDVGTDSRLFLGLVRPERPGQRRLRRHRARRQPAGQRNAHRDGGLDGDPQHRGAWTDCQPSGRGLWPPRGHPPSQDLIGNAPGGRETPRGPCPASLG